jgi:hypothetical protein
MAELPLELSQRHGHRGIGDGKIDLGILDRDFAFPGVQLEGGAAGVGDLARDFQTGPPDGEIGTVFSLFLDEAGLHVAGGFDLGQAG